MVVSTVSISNSATARRAVEQGGVTVNDAKVGDIKTMYSASDFAEGLIVKRGKKNFRRVIM